MIRTWRFLLPAVMSIACLLLLGFQWLDRYTTLGPIESLAFSPDGAYLAAGHRNGRVTLWDPSTRRRTDTLRSDNWAFEKLAVSHDGKWIAGIQRYGNEEAKVRIYDAASGTLVDSLEKGESCSPVAFHPVKPWLVWVTGEEAISIWDVSERREIRQLAPHKVRVSAFAFSRDGRHLAIGVLDMAGVPDNESVIVIWDIERDCRVAEVKGLDSFPREVAYSPDGKSLGSIALGGKFQLWDLKTGTAMLSLPEETWSPSSFSFNPEGTRVSVGLGNGSLLEYSIIDGRLLGEWSNESKDPGSARHVRYDPIGRLLAYSADANVVFQPLKK